MRAKRAAEPRVAGWFRGGGVEAVSVRCLFRWEQQGPLCAGREAAMKVTLLAALIIIAMGLLLAPAFVKAPPNELPGSDPARPH